MNEAERQKFDEIMMAFVRIGRDGSVPVDVRNFATEWRDKVQAYIAARASEASPPQPEPLRKALEAIANDPIIGKETLDPAAMWYRSIAANALSGAAATAPSAPHEMIRKLIYGHPDKLLKKEAEAMLHRYNYDSMSCSDASLAEGMAMLGEQVLVEAAPSAPTATREDLPIENLNPIAELWAEYHNQPRDNAPVDVCHFAHYVIRRLADKTTTLTPCDSDGATSFGKVEGIGPKWMTADKSVAYSEAGRVKLSGVQDHVGEAQIVGGKDANGAPTATDWMRQAAEEIRQCCLQQSGYLNAAITAQIIAKYAGEHAGADHKVAVAEFVLQCLQGGCTADEIIAAIREGKDMRAGADQEKQT